MFCSTHNQYFHPEINESCPDCLAEQDKCRHSDRGPDKLFNSRKYLGLNGEWDVCYDCGKLILYKP